MPYLDWEQLQRYDSKMKEIVNQKLNVSDLAQGTGTDDKTAMSQAATTNEFDTVNQTLDAQQQELSLKVDGGYSEDGYLYLTSNGQVVSDPIPVGSGGGGGGGGGGNNAILTVTNTTGWLSITVSEGASVLIKLNWSSVEDVGGEMKPTGPGVLQVKDANGSIRYTSNVDQGDVQVEVKDYLVTGSNVLSVSVSDVYGNIRTIRFTIVVVALSISSTFDDSTTYEGQIVYSYVPTGNVLKTIYFYIDGELAATTQTSTSNRTLTQTLPAQTHGSHKLEVYLTATIGGILVESNHLVYDLICIVSGNMTPIISSHNLAEDTVPQYSSYVIKYRIYNPASEFSTVNLIRGSLIVDTITDVVNLVEQTWTTWLSEATPEGHPTVLKVATGDVHRDFAVTVTEREIDIHPETEGLALYLPVDPSRSNSSVSPARDDWHYNDIYAQFSNFTWTNDGWQKDKDDLTVLRLRNFDRVTIPYQPFSTDFKTLGKTFEFEFSTSDVMDYDTEVISCMEDRVSGECSNASVVVTVNLAKWKTTILSRDYGSYEFTYSATGSTWSYDGEVVDLTDYGISYTGTPGDGDIITVAYRGIGLKITAQAAMYRANQTASYTQYKEDEHVRVTFVVSKRANDRLIYCYINGIISGLVQYPNDETFVQVNPLNITIGSNYCVTDIYCIRIYDQDLSRYQVVDNWICDMQDGYEMYSHYLDNHIFDDEYHIQPGQLPANLPYLVLSGPALPTYKGDKQTMSGYYVNVADGTKSFSFTSASVDVQGTSSQYYPRKNFKIKFSSGFIMTSSGETRATYAMRNDSIPVNTFTFKADFASSEGANNVELVRYYNDIVYQQNIYRTPLQVMDPSVRQGIDGFPIVIFWAHDGLTEFIGKYNFNNDKGTPEVFGFVSGDESWETLNNASTRVLFKSADYSGTAWLSDFEGRYPDGNTDPTNLSALARWIVATDSTAATGNPFPTPVVFPRDPDATPYPADTAEYRKAKFKWELEDYMEVKDAVFYYIFTELFLMIDSRVKNSFPSKYGEDLWSWLPYDMDTAIGINNEGQLVFSYNLEDTDSIRGSAVYNGQSSVMWNNMRTEFADDIAELYNTLRTTADPNDSSRKLLSYDTIEARFEEHQNKWSASIFNEDAYYKYIQPANTTYYSMCLGSKEEQRKWWLFNRFRYIDSKYKAGDARDKYISFRTYHPVGVAETLTLNIVPYADIYVRAKVGSFERFERGTHNVVTELSWEAPADAEWTDLESQIFSADQIREIGSLTAFRPATVDIKAAVNLQSLVIGDAVDVNDHLQSLALGDNVLLRIIDARNCTSLGTGSDTTVDASGCTSLEEALFDNTKITALYLPEDGGVVSRVHLPGTIVNITIKNQNHITDFQVASRANLTRLVLENVSSAVWGDIVSTVTGLATGSHIRLIGFDIQMDSEQDLIDWVDKLDTLCGVDSHGDDVDTAVLSGEITVPSVHGSTINRIAASYPDIVIHASTVYKIVKFYSWDGSILLDTRETTGTSVTYGGEDPTKTDTYTEHYTWSGWTSTIGGDADPNILTGLTTDKDVYAAFAVTPIYHVRYYSEDGLTVIVDRQTIGVGDVSYDTDDPTKEHSTFEGWATTIGGEVISTTGDFTAVNHSFDVYAIFTWDVKSLEVTTPPTKTRYFIGETIDVTGLVITATRWDDSQEIAVGWTWTPLVTAQGMSYFTVEWEDDSSVQVPIGVASSLAVTTPPTKVRYDVGQNFDPTGTVLTLTYTDSYTETYDSGYTYSPTQLNTEGTQTITYTHTASGLTATTSVTVLGMTLIAPTVAIEHNTIDITANDGRESQYEVYVDGVLRTTISST